MKPSPAWFFVRVGLFLATVSACRGDHFVTVYTSATPEYLKKRAEKDPSTVETYIFMPGRYLEGYVRDRSLERAKFIDIAKSLTTGLKKSAYIPAKNVVHADLLLVVHWGVTTGNAQNRTMDIRDPHEMYDLRQTYTAMRAAENDAVAQPGNSVDPAMYPASGGPSLQYQEEIQFRELEAGTNNMARGSTAAELLGFSSELRRDERRPVASELAKSLTSMLETDRYFILVFAYDWQRWIRERKMVRVWSSRLSISSPGVNFPIALNRMNIAGADSFGTSSDDLRVVGTKKKQIEKVSTGDLIFIGFDPDKKTDSTK